MRLSGTVQWFIGPAGPTICNQSCPREFKINGSQPTGAYNQQQRTPTKAGRSKPIAVRLNPLVHSSV